MAETMTSAGTSRKVSSKLPRTAGGWAGGAGGGARAGQPAGAQGLDRDAVLLREADGRPGRLAGRVEGRLRRRPGDLLGDVGLRDRHAGDREGQAPGRAQRDDLL